MNLSIVVVGLLGWSPRFLEVAEVAGPSLTAPCPEVTESCLEAIERDYLAEAGSIGLQLEPVLEPGAPGLYRVTGVVVGGPSDGLGIQPGDWVVAWDDLALTVQDGASPLELQEAHVSRWLALRKGQRVRLKLVSGKDGSKRQVEIVSGPTNPAAARQRLAAQLWRRYGVEWYAAYRSYLLRRKLVAEEEFAPPPGALEVPTGARKPEGSSSTP